MKVVRCEEIRDFDHFQVSYIEKLSWVGAFVSFCTFLVEYDPHYLENGGNFLFIVIIVAARLTVMNT